MRHFNPLDYPIVFAQPLRVPNEPTVPNSAWLEHVPFAMLIIDIAKPKLLVELGTHSGISYCAFCQSVKALNIDTCCYAIDTWEGDEHAGYYPPEVLAELRSYHDANYGGFSQLLQTTFDHAVEQFADGTIDLLHIDGCHTYNEVKHDFENWREKLSEQAIILFHDIAERGSDFGVWKLWEELRGNHPSFEFHHGHGLGVLCINRFPTEAVRQLLELPEAERPIVREFFYQAGRRLTLQNERHEITEFYKREIYEREVTILQQKTQAESLNERMVEEAERRREEVERAREEAHKERSALLRSHEEAMIALRRTFAERQEQQLQEESMVLRAHNAERAQLREEVAILENERAYLQQRLASIESRLSWQLLSRAWQLQMRVAPPTSAQGRAWMALMRLTRGRTRRRVSLSTSAVAPLTVQGPLIPASHQELAPLSPEEARALAAQYNSYESWVARCEAIRYDPDRATRIIAGFRYSPVISIIMPTYNSPEAFLRAALDSVLTQYYPSWELCICDDASPQEGVRSILQEYAARDSRIRIIFATENRGIGGASNQALALATGDYIGLLDHDDMLTPDALLEVVAALQDVRADFLYSDEDKLDEEGFRCEPFLKPVWSPDLLLTCMYTSHFSVYRRTLVEEIEGFRESMSGSQDYDLALRATEQVRTITHIPKILYHWRKIPGSAAASTGAKPYAYLAAQRALTDALERRGIDGSVEIANAAGYYHIRRTIDTFGKVSIIIPTRDQIALLERCVRSIEEKTEYPHYEIIIIDNDSRDAASLEYLARSPHRVITAPGTFNYSWLNNLGAREAAGEYLLLLNNDTAVLSGSWLSALVEQAQRPEVGAVGAKLLYPDGRIQHAGVILGLGGVASHAQRFVDGYIGTGYYNYPNALKNYSAVTGACLMIRKAVFEAVGGLNETDLPVNFNDVDLCLRLRERGYLVVYTPYCLVRHHESATRAPIVDPEGQAYMLGRWREEILADGYYHPQFDLDAGDFTIDITRPDTFQSMYVQHSREAVTSDLSTRLTIGQELIIGDDDLTAIGVQFATYGRRCKGRVILHLRRSVSDKSDLLTVAMDASDILDNHLHLFAFTPLAGSAGQRLYFFIEFTQHESGERLAVWRSLRQDPKVGSHYENQLPADGTLAFAVYSQRQHYRHTAIPTTAGEAR